MILNLRSAVRSTPPPPVPPPTSPLDVMSRPLTQLLPPDLPAGATSPQFGAINPAASGPQGGHLTSMTNLKSLLQLPIKADPRLAKESCEMKGERMHVCARAEESDPISEKLLKGTEPVQQVPAQRRHSSQCAACWGHSSVIKCW